MSNKRWEKQTDGSYYLYFTPFYEEEHIATIRIDDDGDIVFDSELLSANDEFIHICDGAEDMGIAKREVERLVLDHYADESEYYNDLYAKFKEEVTT